MNDSSTKRRLSFGLILLVLLSFIILFCLGFINYIDSTYDAKYSKNNNIAVANEMTREGKFTNNNNNLWNYKYNFKNGDSFSTDGVYVVDIKNSTISLTNPKANKYSLEFANDIDKVTAVPGETIQLKIGNNSLDENNYFKLHLTSKSDETEYIILNNIGVAKFLMDEKEYNKEFNEKISLIEIACKKQILKDIFR